MVAPRRVKLEDATKDHPKTYPIRVRYRGEYLDLDPYTVTAHASDEGGTPLTPDSVTKATQTGDDVGLLYVGFTSGQLDAVGTYKLDVYLDEEPLSQRFQFEVKDKETE